MTRAATETPPSATEARAGQRPVPAARITPEARVEARTPVERLRGVLGTLRAARRRAVVGPRAAAPPGCRARGAPRTVRRSASPRPNASQSAATHRRTTAAVAAPSE